MLCAKYDLPIVRQAILNKLDKERGVKVCDMPMRDHKDYIAIGVMSLIDGTLLVRSVFHLPPWFDLRHVHNELDQIAEQYKAARVNFWTNGRNLEDKNQYFVSGTGHRGLWPS